MLTPAVLSYEGIAFQYMAPSVFEDSQFEYIQNHLRILSAFYGVLKPMDGVTPYRLDMQAKVEIEDARNFEDPMDIQKFDRLGYSFRADLSSDNEYVFERNLAKLFR